MTPTTKRHLLWNVSARITNDAFERLHRLATSRKTTIARIVRSLIEKEISVVP